MLVSGQFGFQKGVSTENAVYKLTEYILHTWNRKKYVARIFCEFTKASDCVNHEFIDRYTSILWY